MDTVSNGEKPGYARYLVSTLFFMAVALVPLKTVFACGMMDTVTEQCCCVGQCAEDCASQSSEDTCCDLAHLPEPDAVEPAVLDAPSGSAQVDDIEPPSALPPREIGPDPPGSPSTASIPRFVSPLWFSGSDTYLLTQRLRD